MYACACSQSDEGISPQNTWAYKDTVRKIWGACGVRFMYRFFKREYKKADIVAIKKEMQCDTEISNNFTPESARLFKTNEFTFTQRSLSGFLFTLYTRNPRSFPFCFASLIKFVRNVLGAAWQNSSKSITSFMSKSLRATSSETLDSSPSHSKPCDW